MSFLFGFLGVLSGGDVFIFIFSIETITSFCEGEKVKDLKAERLFLDFPFFSYVTFQEHSSQATHLSKLAWHFVFSWSNV